MTRNTMIIGIGIVALLLTGIPASAATTINFDDVTAESKAAITEYAGLSWDNFYVVKYDRNGVDSGYWNAPVSGDYVAFNGLGLPAAIGASGPIHFVGAYFTAAWRDGLQIDVTGYLGGDSLYNKTFTVDTTGPTWVEFGWTDVDQLVFASSGGTPVWANTGTQFAMDNMVYHTPAPGAILLGGLGAGLTGWLRRRRAL